MPDLPTQALLLGSAGPTGPTGATSSAPENEGGNIAGMAASVKFLNNVVIAVLVVLFIGFAGMFVAVGAMMVDALNNKSAIYLQLRDEVMKQNGIIGEQNKNVSTLVETLTAKLNTLIYEVRQSQVSKTTSQ